MKRRKDIEHLRSEMEELFADLCQVPRLVSHRQGFRPHLDVYRTEDPAAVNVVVELAGIEPAEVELSLAESVLTIAGTRRRAVKGKAVYQQMEMDYGPFTRRVEIDARVDPDAIEAVYERGLLRITLPIAVRRTRRVRVDITARGSA
ncbi:MAG: Hsp20/alpha crystallin family protein [Actinomycetota bacterium]|nr:Hsp20/alpha crystallin family protein [Actinomycetota bacterium]